MRNKVRIICTDSYYNSFELLCKEVAKKPSIDEKNLVFCEEKGSLMVENMLCLKGGGTFNTQVYSFGNFLRVNKPDIRALSKEGSAMVVKKLLVDLPLTTLNRGRDIAPIVYELIAQLKSAGVTPRELEIASQGVSGILKNKLTDIETIFTAYENYLVKNEIEDQSSSLSLLPSVIDCLDYIGDTNVYLVGHSGLTKQNLTSIESLILKAKSFTAILPYGDNRFAFVNETAKKVESLCEKLGVDFEIIIEKTPYTPEGDIICSALFNPLSKTQKLCTDKISVHVASSEDEEAEKIASVIKQEVYSGKRYKDFTVVVPNVSEHAHIKKAFELLRVPYYIDTEYKVNNHPLITLIFSYVDCFIKNGEREAVLSLIKNPLYSCDKDINDAFVNYVYKYNINYSHFYKPFTFEAESKEELEKLEVLRERLAEDLKVFNVSAFLDKCEVEKKLNAYAIKLKEASCFEEAAVTEQIYSKIIEIIKDMKNILGDLLDKREFKTIFSSGVSALNLSIIPQYNDAVFIGGFKEGARAKAKNLFVCGLTSSVPGGKEDTALLSDVEIDSLSNLKVIIEPKIKIVNHRMREEICLALSAFSEKLYLSYSANTSSGEKNQKSEILKTFEESFTLKEFPETDGYLSDRQGLRSFASDLADFREWGKGDVTKALAFHQVEKQGRTSKILESANTDLTKQIKNAKVLVNSSISPTTLEEYYKCPFRSFMGHALGVKEREVGEVSSLAIGNLMHDIFYLFVKGIDGVSEETKLEELFSSCAERVLGYECYKKYLTSDEEETSVRLSLDECKKHCFETYRFLSNSQFKVEKENLERKFEISLCDGKVKLGGKIDRVDTFGDYFRVIDYKTGKVSDIDEGLYTGTKLQLWLYALAIKGKKPAGVYYYDVKDEYKSSSDKESPVLKGKTLDNEEIIRLQDQTFSGTEDCKYIPVSIKRGKISGVTTEETLQAYLKYAEKMCENAVREMNDGTIIASPIKGACDWCKYKSACLLENGCEREVKGTSEDYLLQAVNGGDENA